MWETENNSVLKIKVYNVYIDDSQSPDLVFVTKVNTCALTYEWNILIAILLLNISHFKIVHHENVLIFTVEIEWVGTLNYKVK